jgi:hypothetical protein
MERDADEYLRLFKRHLNGSARAQIKGVVCKSVDWEGRTFEAVDENDLPYHHIACGLGALMVKPAVGSDCIIAIIDGESSVAWLLCTDEADEMVFRDGKNGGLINIDDLVMKINTIEKEINNLKTVFSSWVTVPNDGGAALKTAVAGWTAQTISLTQKQDLEDNTILH